MVMEGNESGRSSLSIDADSKGNYRVTGKVYSVAGIDMSAHLDAVEGALFSAADSAAETGFETIKSRLRYLESVADLDGARQELVRQMQASADDLIGKGFTVVGYNPPPPTGTRGEGDPEFDG